MHSFDGNMISGRINEDQEFVMTTIKHVNTTSVFDKEQLEALTEYLQSQQEKGETCTMILNEQLPIPLNTEEVTLIIQEMNEVTSQINE